MTDPNRRAARLAAGPACVIADADVGAVIRAFDVPDALILGRYGQIGAGSGSRSSRAGLDRATAR